MFIAGFPAGSFAANCYVVAVERGGPALVVDPGQDAADRLVEILIGNELTPVAVLLTHGHLDHIADAALVCRRWDVPAYLHGADDHLLDDPMFGLTDQLRVALAGLDLTGLRPQQVSSLSGAAELDLAGLPVRIDHTPGHTGGSVVFGFAAEDDTARGPADRGHGCSPDRSGAPTCPAARPSNC